jgi:type IV pilus assembly protein PilE
MRSMKSQNGFTLIELMVTVAIIAILAAIALPSYMSSVIKGSRNSVQTELMQLAATEEKIYLNSNSYSTASPVVTTAYNGQATGGLGWSGNSKDGRYSFSCAGCTSSTYTLTATPVAGTSQASDGTLSIDQAGNKVWTGGQATTW